MTTQSEDETVHLDKKSGKGKASGVVSELSLYWTVIPGHEQALREAIARFMNRVGSLPPEKAIPTGLRDARLVVFDNGTRFLFSSTFETDWDSYIDDVLLVVGLPYFLDWVQHLEEGHKIMAWAEQQGGVNSRPGRPPRGASREAGQRPIQGAAPGAAGPR